jgi:glycosyltransferase involved in cell wall biosynthesis
MKGRVPGSLGPIRAAIAAIEHEPDVVRCLHLADRLAEEARGHIEVSDWRALTAAVASEDAVLAIAGIHALGSTSASQSAAVLTDILESGDAWRREHAAWSLEGHAASPPATELLLDMVASGGFAGMVAQRTLQRQLRAPGPGIAGHIAAALLRASDVTVRRRLVQTLGLDPRRGVVALLDRIAHDADENHTVRAEAVASLGARGESLVRGTLEALVAEGPLATDSLLALVDATGTPTPAANARGGLRVGQVFLHADLDAGLQNGGVGDNGGIGSLLVMLAEALSREPDIDMVLTLSRGTGADALTGALWPRDDRSVFAAVPFPRIEMSRAWEHRVAAERGIRRQLRAFAPIHAVHLRMADVGSLAAADAAASLRIPVVFTAAPDPHAVIKGLQDSGTITREIFGEQDHEDHWWFRARLVERLARSAQAIALLPRPDVRGTVSRYLGLDGDDLDRRAAVIPEGVRAATVEQARREAADFTGRNGPAVLNHLQARIDGLPDHRRQLPLIVSAGRLHAGKGMHRVVDAWMGAKDLHDAYNLVIVGGDLENPSPAERDVLNAISTVLAGRFADEEGLVLLGHRPHLDTARVFAYAARGGGIYACGSAKEEFGLAIVEALAAGLVPVAPHEGGPPTYLTDGSDGVLVDGGRVLSIRDGIRRARGLVHVPGRAAAAWARVEQELTVDSMARALTGLYRRAAVPAPRVPEGAA